VNPADLQALAEQIAIPVPHLRYLLEQIELYIPKATVWAFGSRVKGAYRPASDLDVAVLCDKETAKRALPKLNEVFVESDLPFKVQLLDFNRLPENMQENIKKRFVVLYQPIVGGKEIKYPVPLQVSLANVHQKVKPEGIYSFIETHADNIQTFWLDPEKVRARRICAAIEYLIVLGAIGSVASIASLLWAAYEKFIGQRKKSKDDDAGLYISIEHPDGTRYNFWIGKEYKDREIFIQEFTKKVEEVREHPDTPMKTKEVISKIIHEDIWSQRKRLPTKKARRPTKK
jgi:predicted nucleotidyltransferase